MKRLFTLLLVFYSFAAAAQERLYDVFPMESGRVTYTRIIDVPGADKARIFLLAKQWALKAYDRQKVALEAEDKEAGLLVYKGYFTGETVATAGINKGGRGVLDVYHTVTFFIKDGKAKVEVADIRLITQMDKVFAEVRPKPIEGWYGEVERRRQNKTISEKRLREIDENRKPALDMLHLQLTSFIEGIMDTLAQNKSNMDF